MTIFDDFFNTQMTYLAQRINWTGLSLVEYGAQHGRHSLACMALGAASALAIEGRQSNLDQVNNPDGYPLETLCADVRKLKLGAQEFDVGLIFGILYHLDKPVEFLQHELPRIKKHLFIWTHYANTSEVNAEQGGYSGKTYQDGGNDKSSPLEALTAFWFERWNLLQCLRDNGFQIVEVVDMPTPVSPHLPGMMIYARRAGNVEGHKVVVARWDEDVTWTRAYPHLIYDKGGTALETDGLNVITLTENPEGHESHTYLNHIIKHYNDLDDFTSFVQGHPFDHANNWDNEWSAEADFAWIGHWHVTDDGLGKPHHPGLPIGAAYEAIFDKPSPQTFDFVAGAQFVASRERIRSHPLKFYKHIQALGFDPRFIKDWGYVLERLWGHILGGL